MKKLIYLIILLALIAGGYYAYQNLTKVGPGSTVSWPEGQVPADWKTYRNEEYKYELRFPPELALVKASDGSRVVQMDGLSCLPGSYVYIYSESELAAHVGDNDLEDVINTCVFSSSDINNKNWALGIKEWPWGDKEKFVSLGGDQVLRVRVKSGLTKPNGVLESIK